LASASLRIRSKTLPRWLCSITPMPLSATFQMSCWTALMTLSGRTAGPALKLKMRSLMIPLCGDASGQGPVQAAQVHLDDIGVAALDGSQRDSVRSLVHVDPGQRRLRAVIDDVLDFF